MRFILKNTFNLKFTIHVFKLLSNFSTIVLKFYFVNISTIVLMFYFVNNKKCDTEIFC